MYSEYHSMIIPFTYELSTKMRWTVGDKVGRNEEVLGSFITPLVRPPHLPVGSQGGQIWKNVGLGLIPLTAFGDNSATQFFFRYAPKKLLLH
jgi:hypothetical protein